MLPDAYGCVVANRFGELLDDEADPFDLLSMAESTEKSKKKKEDVKKAKQKKPGQKESQKERRAGVDEQPAPPMGSCIFCVPRCAVKKPPTREPMSSESRGGAVEGQRAPRRNAFEERPYEPEQYYQENYISRSSFNSEVDPRVQGSFRGGRGGRGAGYPRNLENFNPRGKREYERQSGTGMCPDEKRGGRGSWNWGTVQDTIGDMDVTAAVNPESQAPVEGEEQGTDLEGEVVVQVAIEMSLDEWRALQESSRPKSELNLRKADTEVPSKARVIHESNLREDIKEEDMEDHFLRRSVNDITSRLDINFGSLGRPARGGRGRGRRGAIAGTPEVVTPKFERVDILAPNPDDPEDFPALSAGK
ncbi:intracellular hyaluronan-binding protein 4 isoform X1 [Gadus macrocephalus]|uniref:intracellular hyaluronan-binding protein 4 isoform X1 n=1 Tax=Gadus macrocephalus TaxID=80720 RepID=UPI0028CB9348|nr:intracellular hyaluronan-binding protein 4 isoform X1 [Gadus macrocephalus]